VPPPRLATTNLTPLTAAKLVADASRGISTFNRLADARLPNTKASLLLLVMLCLLVPLPLVLLLLPSPFLLDD
jgi:hypothetical protein